MLSRTRWVSARPRAEKEEYDPVHGLSRTCADPRHTRRVRLTVASAAAWRNMTDSTLILEPATAVAWQSTGRLRSGVGRRHAAPSRVHLEIVDCGRNGPATAVAGQSTALDRDRPQPVGGQSARGRLRSGVGRRHAAPGPVLTPQCPSAALRPPSQVGSHNFKVHPSWPRSDTAVSVVCHATAVAGRIPRL